MKRFAVRALMFFTGFISSGFCAAEDEGQRPMHHPELRGAQAGFHDLMEPLWHSPAGTQRTERACGQAKEIGLRIQAMARERGPVAVLGKMAEASKRLMPACKTRRTAEVDQVLDLLHEDFHELMGMR